MFNLLERTEVEEVNFSEAEHSKHHESLLHESIFTHDLNKTAMNIQLLKLMIHR